MAKAKGKGKWTGKARPTGDFILWEVEGMESGDSSGGPTTFFVATDSTETLPDVHAAIDALTHGRKSLYDVTHVRQVGSLPRADAWPDDPESIHEALWYDQGCHDQTGYALAEADLVGLASRILSGSGSAPASPAVAAPPETASVARLRRAAPELLEVVLEFAEQLAEAIALLPCTHHSVDVGPCLSCSMAFDHARLRALIARVDGPDGGPRS